MASAFYTYVKDESSIDLTIYADLSYPYYRVYIRTGTLNGSGTEVYDSGWFSIRTSAGYYFPVPVTLDENTTYTVNVAYNSSASATGSEWMGGNEFKTDDSGSGGGQIPDGGEEYDTNRLYITVGSGLNYVIIQYYDEYGDSQERQINYNNGRSYTLYVQNGTDAKVVGYDFYSKDYGHPITATGASTFYVTDANGNNADQILGSIYDGKSFSISSTEGGYNPDSGGDGCVYIYNGSSWIPATPYIFNGSSWVQATSNVYVGGWNETKS